MIGVVLALVAGVCFVAGVFAGVVGTCEYLREPDPSSPRLRRRVVLGSDGEFHEVRVAELSDGSFVTVLVPCRRPRA